MFRCSAPALLLLLASLHLQASPSAASSESCALDGYALDTLQASDYWTFRVEETKECILPTGATEEEVVSCDIYISVCKPLGATLCPGFPNSTTCQKVIITNITDPDEPTETHYYDMGTFSEEEFNPIGGVNASGFQAARSSASPISSQDCNSTISTSLLFVCEQDSRWSANNPNVTEYVILVDQLLNPCLYVIELHYDGACYNAPTLSPGRCSVGNYDTTTIASRDFWTAAVSPTACYSMDNNICVFYFAFCHPVPPDVAGACYNSALCQQGNYPDTDPVILSMGKFTDYTFSESIEEGVNGGGFQLDVANGSQSTACPYGLYSEVILVCNTSSVWSTQDISNYIQLVELKDNRCSYTVKIGYNGACRSAQPISKAGSRPSPVGWILIGLFGFAVLSYLVIGSAIMYFAKGARGVRILPHFDFWRNFFVLVLEGCRFSLDVITCFNFDGRISKTGGRLPDYDKI